jgi:hypothetical protein
MRLWVMVIVLVVGAPALLLSLFLNPVPSPPLDQLDKVRQMRRLRLGSALLFVFIPALMTVLPPIHNSWWAVLPPVLALSGARWWPDTRWPIARRSDPIER